MLSAKRGVFGIDSYVFEGAEFKKIVVNTKNGLSYSIVKIANTPTDLAE